MNPMNELQKSLWPIDTPMAAALGMPGETGSRHGGAATVGIISSVSKRLTNLMDTPSAKSRVSASQLRREADRCDLEIRKCIAELRNGNEDVCGILRGLSDWCAER